MLFCDSRINFNKIREENFGPPKWIFYQIWGCWVLSHFSSMFIKTERTWLQTCSKYSKGPPRSRISKAPTLVTIRYIEIKWCKEDEKRRSDAPFEYHFFKYSNVTCKKKKIADVTISIRFSSMLLNVRFLECSCLTRSVMIGSYYTFVVRLYRKPKFHFQNVFGLICSWNRWTSSVAILWSLSDTS